MRFLRSALLAAAVFALAAPARAVVVVATPSNEFIEYFGTPVTVSVQGGPLYLVNTDGVPHSIVSYAQRPDGSAPWCEFFDDGECPLFWSEPVLQPLTPVQGLADTTAGEYAFYCGVHPTMRGTVLIESAMLEFRPSSSSPL